MKRNNTKRILSLTLVIVFVLGMVMPLAEASEISAEESAVSEVMEESLPTDETEFVSETVPVEEATEDTTEEVVSEQEEAVPALDEWDEIESQYDSLEDWIEKTGAD